MKEIITAAIVAVILCAFLCTGCTSRKEIAEEIAEPELEVTVHEETNMTESIEIGFEFEDELVLPTQATETKPPEEYVASTSESATEVEEEQSSSEQETESADNGINDDPYEQDKETSSGDKAEYREEKDSNSLGDDEF